MTISTTIIKNTYNGDGSTTNFTYSFKIVDDDDIQVIIKTISTGAETVKTKTTHYTVSGVGNNSGTVTFTAGNIPTNLQQVILRRSTPQTQELDLIENDPLPANSLETAFDKITSIGQELQEQIDRSIKLSRANSIGSTEFTIIDTARANKILAFDSAGELSIAQELGTFKGNWSAGTSYAVRDLVKDTSTNNIFIATVAHTSSGAQPLTTNADSAKWTLIVDAATASSSSTSAAASAASAAASAATATAAATSAPLLTVAGIANEITTLAPVASSITGLNNALATTTYYTVTVAGGVYFIDGITNPVLNFNRGNIYIFDLSSATNLGHPLLFKDDSTGLAYTAGVTTTGTAGNANANVTIDVAGNAPSTLRYYCSVHGNGMGNIINVSNSQLATVASGISNVNAVGASIANVNTVAGNNANITTVAGANANITTVAGANAAITSVAGQITPTNNIATVASGVSSGNIASVASANTNIGLVAGQISPTNNIATVAAASPNITTVISAIPNINTVASAVPDINTVATANTNIGLVAGQVSPTNNISTVAGAVSSGAISTVASAVASINTVNSNASNINAVAAAVPNINTVAGAVPNINSVLTNLSGINSFADRYRVGASDPVTSLDQGDLAFNTTANAFKYYNGTSWEAIVAGGLTDIVQDGSPQLGGNLDVTTHSIVSTANQNINITPNGTGKVVLSNIPYPNTLGSAGQAIVVNSGATALQFETIQASEITTQGNVFSNYNTISSNCTTTTSSTKNSFLKGVITVDAGVTWTIQGNGTLTII